jgi:hypothetical protein
VATNVPSKARDHFYGLKEGKSDLIGIAIFDRLDKELTKGPPLNEQMWSRREIENYFLSKEVLMRFASDDRETDIFSLAMIPKRQKAMEESILEITTALKVLGKPDIWSTDIKATDDVLDPLFKLYFSKLGLPLLLRKSQYHDLAKYVASNEIDPEISEKLDLIVATAKAANPRSD